MKELFDRVSTDPEARAAFKADPRGWLARHDVRVPESMTVVVHEQSPTEHHVVLPELRDGNELSDADLEMLAGGKSTDAASQSGQNSAAAGDAGADATQSQSSTDPLGFTIYRDS